MGLNLNLFVHGVPNGQKIWGPQEDDRIFIESFYGRRANVEVQLLIDIIQAGGNINSYYTYYRKGNILDKDNRTGSYFALTVRSNEYYTDIFNMYNILDAAYHKYVLGTILKNDISATKFIVQDFDQVNTQLQNLEKVVVDYLGSFSVDSDFVSLNGFIANAKSEASTVNLLECNNLLGYVKKTGNVSVSPLHPTNQVAELTKRKNEEIESIKHQSQQQISVVQNEATQKIKVASEGTEKAIETIKREYASADKTITGLKKQLENEKSSVSNLENELKKNKEELKNYERSKQDLSSKKQELDNANQVLSNVYRSLSAWSEVAVIKGAVNPDENNYKKTVLEKMNKFHPLVDLIFMLILLLMVSYSLLKSPSSDETSLEELKNAKVKIEQLSNKLEETEKQLTQQITVNSVVHEISNPNEIIAKYPDARIDVRELSTQNPNMDVNKKYHISIINAIGGNWKSDSFIFNSDSTTISPIKTGACKIDYVINNVVIKSRPINVVR